MPTKAYKICLRKELKLCVSDVSYANKRNISPALNIDSVKGAYLDSVTTAFYIQHNIIYPT